MWLTDELACLAHRVIDAPTPASMYVREFVGGRENSCITTPFCCIDVYVNIQLIFCFVFFSLCTCADANPFICALIWLQLLCVACLFDLFLFCVFVCAYLCMCV